MLSGTQLDLNQIEAVLFDMDGVLIDSMPYHAAAWQQTLAGLGLAITAEEVYAHEGESGPVAVGHFLRQRGVGSTPTLIAELMLKKQALFRASAQIKVFPGVPEFLAALRGRGKRLGLVTGTARPELSASLPAALQAAFEVIVTGDEVERGKPDPEPYQRALDRLAVLPEHALVIENAPLGIDSARGARVRCWAVESSLSCQQLQLADRCFPDLRTLSEALLA